MWLQNLPRLYSKLLRARLLPNSLSRAKGSVTATSKEASEEYPASDIHSLNIGENVHGFQVKNIEEIPVFSIRAIELVHESTKAEYLHLYRNDSNNVFSINFRTTPKDSRGLPHILEHIVLCGSKLYPVRDPFFKMLNRSLATFMNAMTGSDFTLYPFSTQNYTDYLNLQKIYLDAVFAPNLKELDFMQEGWRLENEDPKDITSQLVIKGVVYNEMKGAFSENESILMQKLQNEILPDNTYGVISGGNPYEIPKLTWDDLKAFHKEYYHPSNARFYSYGNFPLFPSLAYLNGKYLAPYKHQSVNHTVVPKQARWQEAKSAQVACRFELMGPPFEKQNTLCVSLMMSDITDIYDTFLLQFVTELLVKGPNAPFYKSMIEPNFSGGFTPCTGMDVQPRDSIFTVGLQGLQKKDFERVINIFEKTIDQVVAKGFDEIHIDSVLHKYEINIKHEVSNFGLVLLLGLTPIWNHNGNIITALQLNKLMEKLRKEIGADPKYLQKVVEKYFKHNKHCLILSMSPDKEYELKQQDLEKEVIKQKVSGLTEADKTVIYKKAMGLLDDQQKPQDPNLLPTLKMEDVSSDIERSPHDKIKCGAVHTQVNAVNTNGITYFKGILNTGDLTIDQQMLLPLFCYIITKMGTKDMNYQDFDNYVNLHTGGIHFDVHIAESLFQLHSYEPGVLISSFCLDHNVHRMWDIWKQIFHLQDFTDIKRFCTLTQLYVSNLTHGLADSGHIYAMQAACSLVSGSGYQKELMGGLQHILFMKRLMRTSNYELILKEMNNIAKALFDKNKLRCALNVTPKNKGKIVSTFEDFVRELPGNVFGRPNENMYTSTDVWSPSNAVHCQHHIFNVPVNYCSKAILTAPYSSADHAKLRVFSKLLTAKYLLPELREKHGAYGGGAKLTCDGVFAFYSYRDPNSHKTLDAFDNTHRWLEQEMKSFTDQDILEAKLGVFQSVDAPVPPSGKGGNEFLRGLTDDILQRHRAELMAVDKAGLQSVCEKYLNNVKNPLTGKIILGPKINNNSAFKRAGELWTVLENQ